jgi:uncharacterized protein YndB with AHSA1/START domain/DNA-binding transcriptional ArsR family regulator
MDDVFKALADPSRRILLDALFREDGQSMTDLQANLEMSRFGVMKHLQILEKAGLITSTKVGRERRHYLNPIPIQQVYDRWVSKYAGAWAGALTRLKYEQEDSPSMAETSHVYEIYIRTTPERLWQALTSGEDTAKYYFGTNVQNIDQTGANYVYAMPDGSPMLEGKVLEADPPRKLVTTFIPRWVESPKESTVTYEITPEGDVCRLTLRHDRLVAGDHLTEGVINGWARIFSSLKSLLESGEALPPAMGDM